MAFIAGNLDLIVLFAAAGSVPGAVVGYLAANRRGAAIGAVAGVILGPVLSGLPECFCSGQGSDHLTRQAGRGANIDKCLNVRGLCTNNPGCTFNRAAAQEFIHDHISFGSETSMTMSASGKSLTAER